MQGGEGPIVAFLTLLLGYSWSGLSWQSAVPEAPSPVIQHKLELDDAKLKADAEWEEKRNGDAAAVLRRRNETRRHRDET